MKKLLAVIVVVLMGVAALAQSDSFAYFLNEVRGDLTLWFPGGDKFDLYESTGTGLEVQYRNWAFDPLGLGLSLGYAIWTANSDSTDISAPDMSDFDGDLTLIPVGGSLLYKVADWADWNLTVEAGVRYVITQSDIDFLRTLPDTAYRVDLDIDSAWVGLIGGDFERLWNESWSLFLGGGYQTDITHGRTEVDNGHLRDNELQAWFLRAGAKYAF
ncbi:MAG: hypothetical protein V1873_06935 [Verrucomicrobiota bacterium]